LAQHISRRELKKDEVRETFAHGAQAILSHQQFTLYLVIVVVVIGLGIFGWKTYSERQTVKASAAFDAALKVFQSPVGPPQAPGETTYPDDNKKFTEANKQFSDLASRYPHTRPGELARYYAALSLEKLGKNDDAKKWLQGSVNSRDTEIAALARFAVADLDDQMGQGDEAVKLYEQLIAKPTVLVPKAVTMLALAAHYSIKDPSKAADLYGKIKAEYPNTPISEQADQALSLLPSKS
jgi:predicted negative regulator of RcsB-dependent stress response